MYQDGLRVSLQYSKNGVSDTGLEAGYSGQTLGIAVGTWRPGCSGCEAENAAVLGGALSKVVAVGFRYKIALRVPTYGAGLLIGTEGKHRLGLNVDLTDPEGSQNNITNYGAGYAYVSKDNTIAVEVSQQAYENPATTNEIKILSLSYQRRDGDLGASLSYEKRLNDPADNNDEFWMGVGFNSDNWHLGIYGEYHQEVMAILSGFY
jgi:hypothetical protein